MEEGTTGVVSGGSDSACALMRRGYVWAGAMSVFSGGGTKGVF